MAIDTKFINQFISVTSKAALAASYLVGKKDKIATDQAAVDSMRAELNNINMNGQVVIGEGSLDEAPLLYTGEFLGTKKGPDFDIAVDPVEGTNFVANNLPGGIAVLAIGDKGNLFNAPETYMHKIATGKIDIVMGALTRNYKRQKIVDYTVPVHTEVFGALTTSKKPFADVMDMNSADVKLAQVRGSMPAGWAQKNLPNAKITLFDNYPDAMRSIAQGRADAIVDVVDFLGEHMNKHKNVEWQVVDKAIDTWYCGIGVKKNNASLQQWLNVALYTLHRADFVDQTWEKWFGIRQIHSVQPQPYF